MNQYLPDWQPSKSPFLKADDDRWPTLYWAREVPLSGEPADVRDRIAAYSALLKTASMPKPFIERKKPPCIVGQSEYLWQH
jgi:haloalkane dehalogenase